VETLANLESFIRSAEAGSFSQAARQLGLTAAAVSRNVGALERNLGVRLFQRTTRSLTLTEAGERFRASIDGSLRSLQTSIAEVADYGEEPAGVLKVSMAASVCFPYILPLLPSLIAKYPRIRPEWHFENREVDLIAENYDAAIGGGFDLASGLVSRTLAPLHLVVVAAPAYLAGRKRPTDPSELGSHQGIVMRAVGTGRIRRWMLRNKDGREVPYEVPESIVMNDPDAMREAARLGAGITLLAMVSVLSELKRGELVRLLPDWHADGGTISLYYASRTLMPTKTRVFVDLVVEAFRRQRLDVTLDARRAARR
jgi:DNA-binding transcriptional LysR family regulator